MRTKRIIMTGVLLGLSATTLAVTTVITRHQDGKDFLKGDMEKVVVDSAGTLRLARQSREIDCKSLLQDVWSIHTLLAADDGALYLGTGPNAKVIRYADQQAQQVYPIQPADANGLSDQGIRNEHIFAMGQDAAGRLLIGISGEKGKLIRLDEEPEVVFEDERVKYIFAIALDDNRNVYLGTGPEGLVFRLNPFCQAPEVVYDAKDRSILSLAIQGGAVYAGSDERGLVYRIDPEQKRAEVLYDTSQDEVPALTVDGEGVVYAAATSAKAAMLQLKASEISLNKAPGRPDSGGEESSEPSSESLNTANADESKKKEEEKPKPQAPMPPPVKVAGYIYKITPDGFVTDVFKEIAVLYSLIPSEGKLYLGTGNKGQFFSVDLRTEEKTIVYQDETSSQITAAVQVGDATYLGLSNPAKLVKLDESLASIGLYESDLIDAGQPARWGKLQVEADIPAETQISMVCRSGNVKDPNDNTFSDWSQERELTEATDLDCPVGRFCQYRLTLATDDPAATPVIREVAVAHVIPNRAPTVKAIKARRSRDEKKPNAIDILFDASDENKDELEYTLEFRKVGRSGWILLKDELDKSRFQWNALTVEDGRYEVRVIANDRKSNTPETTLTGSRVSDAFVIDNTAPEIQEATLEVQNADVAVDMIVADEFSVLGKVRYTVNSNDKWITVLPDDLVYDTLTETFSFTIEALTAGDHVIAFSVADDLKNTRYQTYEVTIP